MIEFIALFLMLALIGTLMGYVFVVKNKERFRGDRYK